MFSFVFFNINLCTVLKVNEIRNFSHFINNLWSFSSSLSDDAVFSKREDFSVDELFANNCCRINFFIMEAFGGSFGESCFLLPDD